MSSRRLSIRVDEQLAERIERLAKLRGQSESQIVREALARQLNKSGEFVSAYHIARRTGLIGAAKRLPRDLSTNKKHMNGFGRA